jgi:5-methyltetrahydrofolate--homocysteine methyltransferase
MNRIEFAKLLNEKVLILDGGYGTEFIKRGFGGITGEELNLKHPDAVLQLQKEYVENGSDIILANTFNANPMKLKKMGLLDIFEKTNQEAVRLAKEAGNSNTLVFGDLSSTGEFIKPLGEHNFDDVFDSYQRQVQVLLNCKVDGIIIETMSDIKEVKAAILAVRSISKDIPLVAHMTFEPNMRSVTGTPISAFTTLMHDLDVDVIGLNCSTGPEDMLKAVKEIRKYTDKFISAEPNAGKPVYDGKSLQYKMTPADLAFYVEDFIRAGVNILGGCCGTTPEHIRRISVIASQCKPQKKEKISRQFLTSRTDIVSVDPFLIIGERINPASRPTMQSQINRLNFSTIISEADRQKQEGASILDMNLGIEKMLNKDHFVEVIHQLDKISSLPLSLDIQTNKYLVQAMKEYAGRALINSAKVTPLSLERKIKLLQDNGGILILLAMDKKIPKTAEDRVKLILDGINELERNGISRDRVFADALVLAFGANENPNITRKSIAKLSDLGIKTTCGLSNLSFGMPDRSYLNGSFLAQLTHAGLSSAIMNSGDQFVMNSLHGALKLEKREIGKEIKVEVKDPIQNAILAGDIKRLQQEVHALLKDKEPIYISQKILGKALEHIGIMYSKGEIYLPHLLLAADTAQPVFDELNKLSDKKAEVKGRILLATVEGDIHDIGKKIIGTVLKSSGFEVTDIGTDISANDICDAVKEFKPDIVGLSAMMTTTVDHIKEVKKELDQKGLKVVLIAGGASMNQELADNFGCDGYAKSGATVVELCEKLIRI